MFAIILFILDTTLSMLPHRIPSRIPGEEAYKILLSITIGHRMMFIGTIAIAASGILSYLGYRREASGIE